jgi:hypothetical protein
MELAILELPQGSAKYAFGPYSQYPGGLSLRSGVHAWQDQEA